MANFGPTLAPAMFGIYPSIGSIEQRSLLALLKGTAMVLNELVS